MALPQTGTLPLFHERPAGLWRPELARPVRRLPAHRAVADGDPEFGQGLFHQRRPGQGRTEGFIGRTATKTFHVTSEHDEIPFKQDFSVSRRMVSKNGLSYIVNIAVEMGEWYVQSSNFKKSFAHIIFNHSKRLKSIVKNYSVDLTKPFGDDFSQEQLAAYFTTMEH